MPYNGSGTFTNPYNWTNDAAGGILIRADRMDGQDNGIATGLSTAICKDGQTVITANLPMATFRHTGVGNGVARTDYASLAQIEDGAPWYLGTGGGTADVITASATPAITAYVTGMRFSFKAGGTNTTAATINLNGVGAKSITKNGAATAAGDIVSGLIYDIYYDGTNFQIFGSTYDISASTAATSLVDGYTIPISIGAGISNNRKITQANFFGTITETVNLQDNVLQRPEILDYSETKQNVTAASTTVIDFTAGNVIALDHSTSITTLTLSNPSPTGKCCSFTLIRTKDASGTSRTITWPASVKWAAATAPTLTQTTGCVDIISFITVDAGTTWYGFLGGLAFA